nr:SOS response-associated peptidase family protein [uncultured Albidiferax sp.]
MCNRYTPPNELDIERLWHIGARNQPKWWKPVVAPLLPGPYIKPGNVLEVGQWGMIPPNSKSHVPTAADGRRLSTNNARDDRIATAFTYRGPWKHGQRCLIPAESFVEPYWGHRNKNIWWKFARTDGNPWALAGIWSEWTDPVTGEVVPSYSMLTQNCDAHPLLRLMHKPTLDPLTKLPAAEQDKRAVVPIEQEQWDAWLNGTVEQARALIQLPALELFAHGPEDSSIGVSLDLSTGQAIAGSDSGELF